MVEYFWGLLWIVAATNIVLAVFLYVFDDEVGFNFIIAIVLTIYLLIKWAGKVDDGVDGG